MEYRLEKLIPLPMVEIPNLESSIWETNSFYFSQGTSYLIEAASGKGKTSLLSIMYGIRYDYKGSLFIDDKKATEYGSKDWSVLRKEKVSIIFQGLELFDELTAEENIHLKNNICKFKTKNQIIEMAERLDIAAFLNKKSKYLSFGQKQRVAIVRALCQPFHFLFADECFSHIDKQKSFDAMDLIIEECKSRDAGLIFTSLGNSDFHFDKTYAV